uniref:Uncharacterized protein n=1 Tax=Anopheles atroparvus TaxID=41427 RepID=A0A182JAX1_ANOAO
MPLKVSQLPSQNLPTGSLWYFADEPNAPAKALLLRNLAGHKVDDFLLRQQFAVFLHHEGKRELSGPLVRNTDDGRVANAWVLKQNCLELGRWHLEALVLDQLLDTVDDEELAVVVVVRNIAGVQPAVIVDGTLPSHVALHDERTLEAQLAALVGPECPASLRVDHLHPLALAHLADAAGLVLEPVLHQHAERSLAHSISLPYECDSEPLAHLVLNLLAERCCAAEQRHQRAEIIVVHHRVLGQEHHQRRHKRHQVHPVPLNAAKEQRRIEPGHHHAPAVVRHHVEQADAGNYVEQRSDGKRHQLIWQFQHLSSLFRVRNRRNDALVRQLHALRQPGSTGRQHHQRNMVHPVNRLQPEAGTNIH